MPARALRSGCTAPLAAAALVLVVGVCTSAATTTDATWWQLCFSELGRFDTPSAWLFNVTLAVTGMLLVRFAAYFHGEMRLLHARYGSRPSYALSACIVLAGVNLTIVGCSPLNVNMFLHKNASSGITISFLAALAITLVRRRYLSSAMTRLTVVITAALGVAITVFLLQLMTLAMLELTAFALVFVWLGCFARHVHRAVGRSYPSRWV